jgi:hypothetical protein
MTDYVTWPDDALPLAPYSPDYAATAADPRIRTDVQQGLSIQRRRTDLAYDVYDIELFLTSVKYELFRGVIDHFIGADWFYGNVFLDNAYSLLLIRIVQGSMDERPRDGGEWKIAFKIETKDPPVMSDADLTAIIGAPTVGLQRYPGVQIDLHPLNEQFLQRIPDGILRSDLTYGSLDQYRSQRQLPAMYQWQVPMSDDQYAIHRAFLKWRVKNGDGWFAADMLRGASYEAQAVRIVAGSRKDTRSGEDWLVTCQLEVADLPPISAEDTLDQLAQYDSGIGASEIADLLHLALVSFGEGVSADTLSDTLHSAVGGYP